MVSTNSHYETLAASYDALWSETQSSVDSMTDLIVQHLQPQPASRIADIGGGTGIFAKALLQRIDLHHPIKVVDPSPSMLKTLNESSQIETLVEDADRFSRRGERVDRILIKEAVHHFPDAAGSLQRLAQCLEAYGRIVIVMLPRRIEYPLFQAALDKFEALQPDPQTIADALTAAGLDVDIERHAFTRSIPTARYIEMVESRYMSLLSEFSDEELATGIQEMRQNLPDDTVSFSDWFVLVTGVHSGD
ncbi:MAG: class I SAM-dependent methyltransferase [Pseudomonadota bacterium]